jgi:CheY-like chemotaxis protein
MATMTERDKVEIHKIRVLLVEDEQLTKKIHTFFLEEINCETIIANDGEEAIEKATDNFDLIIMDIGLPTISGIETIKIIRENENINNKKHLPIIALTANKDENIKKQCLAVGADDLYMKPIDQKTMLKIVKKYCVKK